jgi:peroxiredoxin
MDTNLLGLYVAAVFVAMIAPGPDMMFILATGMRGGARAGLLAVLGVVSSEIVQIAAVAAGLSALFAEVPAAFTVLRLCGAASIYVSERAGMFPVGTPSLDPGGMMSSSPVAWLVRSPTPILVSLGLVIAISIAFVFVFKGASGKTNSTSAAASTAVGFSQLNTAAPQFELPLLQHKGDVQLNKLAGVPIVINLWASDCDICKEESPAIATVSRAVGDRVRFLGVDTLDERGAAIRFAERYKLRFPIAYDSAGIVAAKYRVPGLPVTFFISKTATRILGVNIGALTAQNLIHILHKLYGVGT